MLRAFLPSKGSALRLCRPSELLASVPLLLLLLPLLLVLHSPPLLPTAIDRNAVPGEGSNGTAGGSICARGGDDVGKGSSGEDT